MVHFCFHKNEFLYALQIVIGANARGEVLGKFLPKFQLISLVTMLWLSEITQIQIMVII